MNGKRLLNIIVPLVVAAGCVALSLSMRKKPAPEPVPSVAFTDYNKSITNAMSEFPAMDHVVDSFMRFWALKGVSIAVTRNDSLLYARGYGKAGYSTPMTPGTTMRLASVSKLLTAVGIMRLVEEGKLQLETPVFGPFGVLDEYDSAIRDDNYYLMTVEHLLRHQGGFHYLGADVMFSGYHPNTEDFVKSELRRNLAFVPGTWQQYSNFGYLILSLVIEKASGMRYEDFMQKEVFDRCGCHGFRIAGNYLQDRHPGESMYFMQPDAEPVTSFDGKYAGVEKCYGGNDVTSLRGAGAWIGSAVEMARVVSCIDGFGCVEDVLLPDSVRKMTTWYDENTFSLGWVDTKDGEWTRTGSFSGTSALVKVFPDGECWVLISNTSAWRGSKFTRNTSHLVKNLRSRFSARLPKRDLFSE
mgnify:CR=1 FL=1